MKLANVSGRAALVLGDEIADVAKLSDGRFGPDLAACYERWDAASHGSSRPWLFR